MPLIRAFLLLFLVMAVSLACSGPSFEEKRNDVLSYLNTFNSIDNSLSETTSTIQFPRSGTTVANLVAFNAAVNQYTIALDGAIRRLEELRAPSSEPETKAHLDRAKTYLLNRSQTLDKLKQSISSGNLSSFNEALNKLSAIGAEASTINRVTEQLMLKYNISDREVDYRLRGK